MGRRYTPINADSKHWGFHWAFIRLICVYRRSSAAKLLFVAVGTPVSRRPPHRSVRAELLHTAPTLDDWRRSAHSDAGAGSSHLESIDRPTTRTVPTSSCLAGSDAGARDTIAR